MFHRMYVACIATVFISINSGAVSSSIEQAIVRHVNEVVAKALPSDGLVLDAVQRQLKRFRFITDEGVWTQPEFEGLGQHMVANATLENLQTLVGEMGDVATKNDYLKQALFEVGHLYQSGALPLGPLSKMDTVLPDVVSYAYVLEHMNREIVNNPCFLEAMCSHLESLNARPDQAGFMQKVKYYSVKVAVDEARRALRKGKVNADFASYVLPVNIAEATALEWWYQHSGNAQAGKTLMRHCLDANASYRTGQKPAQFNVAGSALLLTPPLPKDWAKLYAVWNMGFVANLRAYPFHMAKLMIPSVNNFYAEPGQYIFNRAMGLYVHVHYLLLSLKDDQEFREMDFHNEVVASAFSRANGRSAAAYESKLQEQSLR